KHFAHHPRKLGRKRELLPRPVARLPNLFHLPLNRAAALFFPPPDALDELLAPQIPVIDLLLGQLPHHHALRGNARVVRPSKYSVLYPRMRCQRVRMSISVWSSMWPMCRDPVTFGGGITIAKTGPGFAGSALNSSSFTQNSAQRGSISFGSYALAISRDIPVGSPRLPAQRRMARSCDGRVIFEYTGSQRAPSIIQRKSSGRSFGQPLQRKRPRQSRGRHTKFLNSFTSWS